MDYRDYLNFSKEIYALRLSITTGCILGCKYCFVKKTNQMMDFLTAQKAIDLLLISPGKKKLLLIYGGEPLLHPSLKKIILLALDKAKNLKKELDISLATNGLLLDKDFLSFFKKKQTRISISIDGDKETHDQNRVFINGNGSFNLLSRKLPLVFNYLNQKQLSAIMTITPKYSNKMFNNFSYLIKKGFRNIHLEPVQKTNWSNSQKENFYFNFEKIINYVLKNIENKKFIFLNSINPLLNQEKNFEEILYCPFYKCLEIYPQGEMAFSPFLLNLPESQKKRYIVGNVKKRFIKRYQNCHPGQTPYQCQNCCPDYYQDIKKSGARLVSWRNQLYQKATDHIYQRSLSDKNFKRYIKEAKKRIFE